MLTLGRFTVIFRHFQIFQILSCFNWNVVMLWFISELLGLIQGIYPKTPRTKATKKWAVTVLWYSGTFLNHNENEVEMDVTCIRDYPKSKNVGRDSWELDSKHQLLIGWILRCGCGTQKQRQINVNLQASFKRTKWLEKTFKRHQREVWSLD